MAINRRRFLKSGIQGSIGVAVGISGLGSNSRAVAPSDKVIVGMMGVGGRGIFLTGLFASRPDVEVAYVCDVDAPKLPHAVKVVEDTTGRKPRTVGNFQRVLEDKGVDAIVCATPDHWHAPAPVLTCQAGKDIYLEKPVSNGIWEGHKIVEAVRKYKRVVQAGMQNRSSTCARTARDHVQSGRLGGYTWRGSSIC